MDGTSNCCVCRGEGEVVLLVCTKVSSTVFGVVVELGPGRSVVVLVTTSSMTVLVVKVTEIVRVIFPSTSVVTTVTGTVVVTEITSEATAPSNVLEAESEAESDAESEPAEAELDPDRTSVADRRLAVDVNASFDTTPVLTNRPSDVDIEESVMRLCCKDWLASTLPDPEETFADMALLLPDMDIAKPVVNTEVVVLEGSVVTGIIVVTVVVKVLVDSPEVTVNNSVIVVTARPVVERTTASVPLAATELLLVELFDEITNSTAPPSGEPAVNTMKLEDEFVKSA